MSDAKLLETITNSVKNAARDFCFYSRKEDEELSADELKDAVGRNLINLDAIGAIFVEELKDWGGLDNQ